MEIGAQLYTVRDYCQTPEDFDLSMAKISAIGYKTVQISAVGNFGAEKIRDICDRNGLSIILTHTNPKRILEETEAVIAEHKIMGAEYIGIGSMPGEYHGSAEGAEKFINDFLPAARKIRDAGLKFMYHNHSFEFEKHNGKNLFERLIERFDSGELGFVLDVYWITHGGGDPAFWLRKLAGRVDTIHFKDMQIIGNSQKMAPVLAGNLDWDEIIKACGESGVKWAFIEQDDCNGDDPFDCLKISFDNLHAKGLC